MSSASSDHLMHVRHLLLAEDNADDVFIFKMAFRKATLPYSLHVAENGETAISWLNGVGVFANRNEYPVPDVLITDLKMPRTDGFELLKWVRSQPSLVKLPVIVLSSSDEPRDVTKAYQLGATTYFLKSPGFQDVIQFLRTLTLPLT